MTANNGSSNASVRLNDGSGNFTPPATNSDPGIGSDAYSVALGDVDGDGDLDFVTANSSTNTVSVRLNRPLLALTLTGLVASPNPVCAGQPFSVTATVGNLTGSYSYTLTNGSNPLSGTATTSTFSQSVTASGTGSQSFTLTIVASDQSASGVTAVTVNPLPLASLTNSGPLSCTNTSVILTAGGGNSYTFTSGSGVVGTPGTANTLTVSTPGTYSVTVASASGCVSTTSTTVISNTAMVMVSNPVTTTATINASFSQSFTASGGTSPYSYSLASGSLPSGLSLATTGVLSGTPTQAGSFTITVKATDATGCSGVSAPYVLTVSKPVPTQPDLSPLLYARPTLVNGQSPVTVVVDVSELNSIATNGSFTVRVTKDPILNLNFDASLSSLDGRAVQNSVWRFSDSDPDYYILTTSQPIAPGDQLSFGLSGTLRAGASTGVLTVSATVLPNTLVEGRLNNNVDADKVEYFQQ